MNTILRNAGSFRDPAGFVFEFDNNIYRAVTNRAIENARAFMASNAFARLDAGRKIVRTQWAEREGVPLPLNEAREILLHERVPFISYPYEWPFELLQQAALLHLDVQIETLKEGFTLSDASAYNVQFIGPDPIFIDLLSFRRYVEGEIWSGYRQFRDQFLNPLLMHALVGVTHQHWYRGSLEGINSGDLARMLPWTSRFSPSVLTHVVAPARMDRKAAALGEGAIARAASASLPKTRYLGLLQQLRQWIAMLEPRYADRTTWQDYDRDNTYDQAERAAKRAFVQRFCVGAKPAMLLDIGCNTGEYSQAALEAGAGSVVGLDFDAGALRKAHGRARSKKLSFLPLYQDGANQSPGQGWGHSERRAISDRGSFDGVLALAVEHHLAIGRNIPLDQVVAWIVAHAPRGVVEFVPKSDPTVRTMLALREDIFPNYTREAFEAALTAGARIVQSETVSTSGRVLYAFERA